MTGTRIPLQIAVLDDYQGVASSVADWSFLEGVRVTFFHDHVEGDDLVARLQPYDAVVLVRERTRFDAAVIGRLPNLKLLLTFGMWNAAIDVRTAATRGIVVSGTDGGGPQATAALTWALILGITRNVVNEAASVRAGGWQVGLGVDIARKNLALLGFGNIGQKVGAIGKAFGMNVIAWSENLTAERAAAGGARHVSRDELFREADVLSIHLKLSERSRDLVGAPELGLMKQNAYVINTSRGPIISEPALIDALSKRSIGGAGLDVFDREPLPLSHPFRYLPNVLATPHIGYVNIEGYQVAYAQIVENIRAWQAGAPIRTLGPE